VLHSIGITFNRELYRLGILKSHILPRPVISVGNLTAGGGGKTPLVMWLAESLVGQGLRPAILSRGYGRKGDGVSVVDPDSPWDISGDEPSMMARRLKDVPVVVSVSRYLAGMKLLQSENVDLFILDDGYQHYALNRDMDVVTIDNRRRFGNGWLLPAGILREPVKRLRDADFVVVTKSKGVDPAFEKRLTGLYKGPLLWADYIPVGLSHVRNLLPDTDGTDICGPCLAFCGIADPESFRATLHHLGLETEELIIFPDHHPYSEADVARILESARRAGANALVTTEKDAVRLPEAALGMPCYVPIMETVFPQGASLLIQRIMDLARGKEDQA
jgi:tetraacyldisaccharide 4'-kinase